MRSRVKSVLVKGSPRLHEMVVNKQVRLSTMAGYLRTSPTAWEQKNATPEEIKKIARARIKEEEARGPRFPKAQDIRPTVDFTKLDVGNERIHDQPVLLRPAHIERLEKNRTTVMMAMQQVSTIGRRIETQPDHWPSSEAFAAALKAMLAYEPVADKSNGEERDYANEARRQLAFGEARIDQVISWLTEIRAVMRGKATADAS